MDRNDLKRRQVHGALAAQRHGSHGEVLVAQVMTAAPECVHLETTALELVRTFHAKGFRHLPVTDASGRLVGIISDRDVLRALGPGDALDREALAKIPAADLMSTDLVTVGPQAALAEAVGLLVEHGISSLPVLVDGILVGILTTTDLYLTLQILLHSTSSIGTLEPYRVEGLQPA